jgi:hypothetical protein
MGPARARAHGVGRPGPARRAPRGATARAARAGGGPRARGGRRGRAARDAGRAERRRAGGGAGGDTAGARVATGRPTRPRHARRDSARPCDRAPARRAPSARARCADAYLGLLPLLLWLVVRHGGPGTGRTGGRDAGERANVNRVSGVRMLITAVFSECRGAGGGAFGPAPGERVRASSDTDGAHSQGR